MPSCAKLFVIMIATLNDISETFAQQPPSGAAVLIPLVEHADGLHVLFEVRAASLAIQPSEVCLPGGHVERGETPQEAAIRETCEELLVDEKNVRVLGTLGCMEGPGGRALWVFVGTLVNYEGTFSPDEVDHTFTLPLDWLLTHNPACYTIEQCPVFPDDFPWNRIPGGRAYPWRSRAYDVPFYLETEPLLWGATARVIYRFSQALRDAIEKREARVPCDGRR